MVTSSLNANLWVFSFLYYSHLGQLTDKQVKKKQQWISVLSFSPEEGHTSPAQIWGHTFLFFSAVCFC